MNQLEYTGSHKSLSQRCSCLSMMPQIIQNTMILRFRILSLELMSKKQIQSPRKRNGNYRSNRRLLK
jgi:hypothetical protein